MNYLNKILRLSGESDKKTTGHKASLLGDSCTGKSCIVSRLKGEENWDTSVPTIGIDFTTLQVEMNGEKLRIYVWDTAGQERYRALIQNYCRNLSVAILVFDLHNPTSFENLVYYWHPKFKEITERDAQILVVGNKSDLVRRVNPEQISHFLDSVSLPRENYVEVSCTKNKGLDLLKEKIGRLSLQVKNKRDETLELRGERSKTRGGSCFGLF